MQLVTGLLLLCCFGGIVATGYGLEGGKPSLTAAGAGSVAAGLILMALGFRTVNRSKCPRCGAIMRQGGDAMHADGVFVCRGCGGRWRTSFRFDPLGD
jgi:hypothetical protein